ncbi:hypothetical protein V494_01344 [Pseudogymnoascus sp. VKM F-4513 (FW-928)]|nr:hypothetical protein V494_01344 [Pseudogymnoascus sp. VKM F-4513 (FW-928)]
MADAKDIMRLGDFESVMVLVQMEGGLATERKLRDTGSSDVQKMASRVPQGIFQQWIETPLASEEKAAIEGIEG